MPLKRHAALYWLLCAASAARDRSWAMSGWRAASLVLVAGLVVPGAVFGWLAWRGGLGQFLEILTGYVVPLDSRVGYVSPWQAIAWHSFGRWVAGLLLVLTLLALLVPPPREPARKGLALVGALYGLVHFVVQGKGWEYQLYPLILFGCALAPAAVVSWRAAGWAPLLHPFRARRPIPPAGLGPPGVPLRGPGAVWRPR